MQSKFTTGSINITATTDLSTCRTKLTNCYVDCSPLICQHTWCKIRHEFIHLGTHSSENTTISYHEYINDTFFFLATKKLFPFGIHSYCVKQTCLADSFVWMHVPYLSETYYYLASLQINNPRKNIYENYNQNMKFDALISPFSFWFRE